MATLSPRALNRATPARQHLLARTEQTAVEMVEHLVGLQAQAPFPPYTGLWTRLAAFQPDELAGPLVNTERGGIALEPGTGHLVRRAAPSAWSAPPTRASCGHSSSRSTTATSAPTPSTPHT